MIKQLHNYSFGTVIPFVLLHVGCIAAFFVPFRWSWVGLMLAMYAVRMFGITAGYHRYFSHRSFKLGRGWRPLNSTPIAFSFWRTLRLRTACPGMMNVRPT